MSVAVTDDLISPDQLTCAVLLYSVLKRFSGVRVIMGDFSITTPIMTD